MTKEEQIKMLKEQRAVLRASNEKFRKEFIDKACEWLEMQVEYYVFDDGEMEVQHMLEDFRKAMTAKTNPIFEKCLSNVNPDTRAEVRKNMDAVLLWHKSSEELPKMAYFTTDGDFSDLCVCINEAGEHKILVLCESGEDTYWAYGYDGEGLYDKEMDGGEIVKWMELPKED